ncbi:extracellular matrix regulator RemB [Candidatus Soleaferrea massiliensis]|uniref:extracellular matrix regulator RemB n=1 Tax=Candidatus Soleaferrea massiliensis TaxID=1470354 RepID=UPI00058EEDBA|nr:extracellular matrix/biofilm biosynthesis regulator RemA family protein [Candidatus Soleaferrea massiliensis]
MYLHLGQDTVVKKADIIGIFDIENTSVSKSTKEYLRAAEKLGRVVNVSEELPKSFVVCGRNGKVTVYISQISCATLKKRERQGFVSEGSFL